MHANCSVERRSELNQSTGLRKKFKQLFLISSKHPAGRQFFRSDMAMRKEQQRQVNLGYFVIHPFSKFRACYEIWLLILFTSLMITKPIDASFTRNKHYNELLFVYTTWTFLIDLMSFVDILATCLTGYLVSESNKVELRRKRIVKKYVLSLHFITDVLSSLPRSLLYWKTPNYPYRIYNGLICIFCLLKIRRLPALIRYIYKVAHFFEFTNSGKLFLFCCLFVTTTIIHYMTCLQFAVPRLGQRYFADKRKYDSWIYEHGIFDNDSIFYQYILSLFKSSAYILGIRVTIFRSHVTEEYITAMVTYIFGKFLLSFMWITLAVAILNSRSMEIKFFEILNQLDEYMKQKHLPLNLKTRISQLYNFKYQKKYFKEDLITKMLSINLKTDVDKHLCKSLIKNVSLFANLTPLELGMLVKYLVPQYFLPNDIIIKSGSYGDAIYFLASGTVAVYTHSGKEICHLQDGAYFGEICLVLKGHSRTATIIAVEISHVYRLNRRDFFNSLYKNKAVMDILLAHAELRLKDAQDIEEMYKKLIFEKSHQVTDDTYV